MERADVLNKLTIVFKTVFDNDTIELNDELTANDIERWDSLSHMILINEIETAFQIKFKLKELNKMQKVGDMIDMILSKV